MTDKKKQLSMRNGIILKAHCDRCEGRLTTVEASIHTALKGGYSGFFCNSCMNSWNQCYHASDYCLMLRKADLKMASIEIVATGCGIDQLEKVECAIDEAALHLNGAMRGLYELAKTWVATYTNNLGLKKLQETMKEFTHLEPTAKWGPDKLDGIHTDVKQQFFRAGERLDFKVDAPKGEKKTYTSPFSGKEV